MSWSSVPTLSAGRSNGDTAAICPVALASSARTDGPDLLCGTLISQKDMVTDRAGSERVGAEAERRRT